MIMMEGCVVTMPQHVGGSYYKMVGGGRLASKVGERWEGGLKNVWNVGF